ncbi:MAG: PTS sugar transporter subunit IIA [Verrucomicrobia bacterium]|nr:PTS sugar transporter subunit IIA [Verrucomicrobiota bacterium]
MAQLFAELLDTLRLTHPELNIDAVRNNLIRQEHEYSSYVGFESALPHFHVGTLATSVVMVAKLHTAIPDPHGTVTIRYVFLVLSPSSEPRTHLQALAEISRFVMDAGNRERLGAARDIAALRHIFFPRGKAAQRGASTAESRTA